MTYPLTSGGSHDVGGFIADDRAVARLARSSRGTGRRPRGSAVPAAAAWGVLLPFHAKQESVPEWRSQGRARCARSAVDVSSRERERHGAPPAFRQDRRRADEGAHTQDSTSNERRPRPGGRWLAPRGSPCRLRVRRGDVTVGERGAASALFNGMPEVTGVLTGDLSGSVHEATPRSPEERARQATATAVALRELASIGSALSIGRLEVLLTQGARTATATALQGSSFLLATLDPSRGTAQVEQALRDWKPAPAPPTAPVVRRATPPPLPAGPVPVAITGPTAAFSGHLSVFSLPELLEFLRTARRSGLLVCRSAAGSATDGSRQAGPRARLTSPSSWSGRARSRRRRWRRRRASLPARAARRWGSCSSARAWWTRCRCSARWHIRSSTPSAPWSAGRKESLPSTATARRLRRHRRSRWRSTRKRSCSTSSRSWTRPPATKARGRDPEPTVHAVRAANPRSSGPRGARPDRPRRPQARELSSGAPGRARPDGGGLPRQRRGPPPPDGHQGPRVERRRGARPGPRPVVPRRGAARRPHQPPTRRPDLRRRAPRRPLLHRDGVRRRPLGRGGDRGERSTGARRGHRRPHASGGGVARRAPLRRHPPRREAREPAPRAGRHRQAGRLRHGARARRLPGRKRAPARRHALLHRPGDLAWRGGHRRLGHLLAGCDLLSSPHGPAAVPRARCSSHRARTPPRTPARRARARAWPARVVQRADPARPREGPTRPSPLGAGSPVGRAPRAAGPPRDPRGRGGRCV